MLARARGEDDRPVETEEEDAKSYSQQETFGEDIGEFATIERVAKGMLDDLMAKVRADQKRVRTITVKVRYPDFTQESHGQSLEAATDLEAPFYSLIAPLLRAAWRAPTPPAGERQAIHRRGRPPSSRCSSRLTKSAAARGPASSTGSARAAGTASSAVIQLS